jgi:hypothetical protein
MPDPRRSSRNSTYIYLAISGNYVTLAARAHSLAGKAGAADAPGGWHVRSGGKSTPKPHGGRCAAGRRAAGRGRRAPDMGFRRWRSRPTQRPASAVAPIRTASPLGGSGSRDACLSCCCLECCWLGQARWRPADSPTMAVDDESSMRRVASRSNPHHRAYSSSRNRRAVPVKLNRLERSWLLNDRSCSTAPRIVPVPRH